jgi:acyl-CoA synthetase (AMP-forming)/AMP-acid ligase II
MHEGGGRLLPGIEFRVVRPDGALSKPDGPGELFIKSPAAALGYWGNPSACVSLVLHLLTLIEFNDHSTKETFIDG